MTGLGLGLGTAWAAWVLVTTWSQRPPPGRVHGLGVPVTKRPPGRRPAGTVGRVALAGGHRLAPRRVPGHWSLQLERRVGRTVLAAAACAPVHLLLAVAAGLGMWCVPVLTERRARSRDRAEVRGHLPEAVDLLALAVSAGMNVPLAVAAVARRAPGPVAAALDRAVAETRSGRRLGDALADLPGRLGEEARPLVAVLVSSERYGAPAAAGLDRLAAELRVDRRRRAEEAARRVPVKLLFPLVSCILPAFALLTVAPLLAGALAALRP